MTTPRERVRNALRRHEPESVPFDFHGFAPATLEAFRRETGAEDPLEYFQVPVRPVARTASQCPADYRRFYTDLPPGTTFDDWGVARVPSGTYHLVGRRHPMRDFASIQEIEAYPWPDVDAPYRYEEAARQAAAYHQRGLAVKAIVDFAVFDRSWQLRGFEQFLVDLKVNPALAQCLMDHVEALLLGVVRRWAETGIDILLIGEDVGMQDRMLLHPDDWRRWIKPRLARLLAEARAANPDCILAYHSDGNIAPIIPDLVEIGVEVLNPVQPECMDPAELKRQYGNHLAFWGTIGTQTTMPFGTPEDVRREVRERVETVGRGGGLLLAPSHILEPEVPWANIVAFVEAARASGT